MGLPLDKDGSPKRSDSQRPNLTGESNFQTIYEQKTKAALTLNLKSILKPEKPLICIDIKIATEMQRIDVYRDDNPKEVVKFFCEKHKLTQATAQYLHEKVLMYR